MQSLRNILPLSLSAFLPFTQLTAEEKVDESPVSAVETTQSAKAEELNHALILAIAKGDAQAVNALIVEGADVNVGIGVHEKDLYAEDKGQTVLMLAAQRGRTDIVEALIAAGADVNRAYSCLHKTALMTAAKEDNADIVKVLIAAGAKIEATSFFGRTALIEAASGKTNELNRDSTLNAIKALIAAGANVNTKDLDGYTPLMEAAKNNHSNTVRALILAGADPKLTDNSGRTALDWAAQHDAYAAYNILCAAYRS